MFLHIMAKHTNKIIPSPESLQEFLDIKLPKLSGKLVLWKIVPMRIVRGRVE